MTTPSESGQWASQLTEEALARRFVDLNLDALRYDHTSGCWIRWGGFSWVRDATRAAFAELRDFIQEATRSVNAKRSFGSASFATGVERLARTDQRIAVTSEVWDADRFLLGTPSGTVDLRTGLLRQADPRDLITKLTAVGPSSLADCPRWRAFLSEVTGGDLELMSFLQLYFGYVLTGDTSEQVLTFLYGPGGNGKSVFVNTVGGVMGQYATTAPMETFTARVSSAHPTELAMLEGARLVTASETEEGRTWASSRIKELTGGGPISARRMFQDFSAFIPQFKLVLQGNNAPQLGRVDEAIRRRFLVIAFDRQPAVPEKDLASKLQSEWSGILRWMIEGCLNWQRDGLQRPPSVSVATAEYFDQEDVFGRWLEECCEVKVSDYTSSATAFQSWSAFAALGGHPPGNAKDFGADMKAHGFTKTNRTIDGRVTKSWVGLSLRKAGAQSD